MFKKQIQILMMGGFVGAILAAWLAPKGISWYFDPPVDIGVNCREATEWSMQKLRQAQLFGFGSGAVLSVVIAFFLNKRKAQALPPQSSV